MPHSKTITFPADVLSIKTRVDGSLAITLNTQELNPEDVGVIYGFRTEHVSCALKSGVFEDNEIADIPEPAKEFDADKTPSQRLRAVLFVYHQQNKAQVDFDTFYRAEIEKIINHYKGKLEP